MYGLVNKAIEEMVCTHYGESTWEAIKQEAALTDIDYFVSMESYPDDVTHRLVRAACKVLNLSSEEILQAFGEYWVTYTAEEGYGEMLAMAGDNLPEFLRNLDNLHMRVGLNFPELKPPSFQANAVDQNALQLDYHSGRQGLAPMVIGLLKGLGRRFKTEVDVSQTGDRNTGADHDTFLIKYK
jgi:hypothetical protein